MAAARRCSDSGIAPRRPGGPHLIRMRHRGHNRRELVADVSLYLGAAVLPLGVIAWLTRLWAADISVPFVYGGDELAVLSRVEGLIETGSTMTNLKLPPPPSPQCAHMQE